jgi:hypothetical protein
MVFQAVVKRGEWLLSLDRRPDAALRTPNKGLFFIDRRGI